MVTMDVRGEFAEMQNLRTLWPGWGSNMAGRAPWPAHSARARLGWLVSGDAELWCPTVSERDTLWQQRYGETAQRVRQAQVLRNAGSGYVPV